MLNNIRFNDFITCKQTLHKCRLGMTMFKNKNDLAHWGSMCAAGQVKLPKNKYAISINL